MERPGDRAVLEASGRFFFVTRAGRLLVFRSEHNLEERLIELTDDYRDADGRLLLPELEAWNGVSTCEGVIILPPEKDA